MTQSRDERQRFPVAVGDMIAQARSTPGTSPKRSHVRLGPRLVDEDETRRIDGGLALAPLPAAACDIRTVLFAGEHAFFYGSGSRA